MDQGSILPKALFAFHFLLFAFCFLLLQSFGFVVGRHSIVDLYEIVRHQLSYMQLNNTQHAYNLLQNTRYYQLPTCTMLRFKPNLLLGWIYFIILQLAFYHKMF